jgi:GNAT superfamily N-acetyltransferase
VTRLEEPTCRSFSGTSADVETFSSLDDSIYGSMAVRWPPFRGLIRSLLQHTSAFVSKKEIAAFGAFQGEKLVARAGAITDPEYEHYWGERVGHIILFEALPNANDEANLVLDAACEWLRARNVTTARVGFSHFEMPLQTGDYGTLVPIAMRQNPAYYHEVLRAADFRVEKEFVGYKIVVDSLTTDLLAKWRATPDRLGFEIESVRSRGFPQCLTDFTEILNATFSQHWGRIPLSYDEVLERMNTFSSFGALDASALAYHNHRPVGFTFSVRECTALAVASRLLKDEERLNLGGETGVLEEARAAGLGRALVAHAYTDFIRNGAKCLYYGPVLADNWSSRRIAESLAGQLMASSLVYRRELQR